MSQNEEITVDPLQFLVAIIDSQGDEVRIPYSTFVSPKGEKALTIGLENDGATIVLRLVDVPEELNVAD